MGSRPRGNAARALVLALAWASAAAVAVAAATTGEPAPAPAETAPAETAPADTEPADTAATVILPLAHVDVDSLLRAGRGLILAWEDTIPLPAGMPDTIVAAAPRLRIEEVVRRIGERMAAERLALHDHSYTALVRVEAVQDEKRGRRGEWTSWESVQRVHLGRDGTYEEATLWKRERKWDGDELKEEKVDDEVETDWGTVEQALLEALPFSLETGDEYNYEILDRRLAGLSVIYEIRFTPRSRFKALPAGRIWVDLGDWVIRRVEGRMTGTVPMPMILESIPSFKLRRMRRGDAWVLDDLYAEVDLRKVPLLGLPDRVRIYVRTSRHVVDGVSYADAPAGSGDR